MGRFAVYCLTVLCGSAFLAGAAPPPSWRLMQSPHFEIYSQTSDQRTRAILDRFEQLRAFFEQPGWTTSSAPPSSAVRVILFASAEEYGPYRLRATADAYSVESAGQDYIVMAGGDMKSFRIAAHEYAHLALRAAGGSMPPWLREGLAEVYSTLHIGLQGTELGGPLRARLRTLHHYPRMPLADLTSLTEDAFDHQDRAANDVFYAESWALTGMLALSAQYAAKFPKFVAAAAAGSPTLNLLTTIYGKSADQIGRDLRSWVAEGAPATVQLPAVHPGSFDVRASDVTSLAARVVLAQLLLAAGEFDRAEALFATLNREAPDSPEVAAGLGVIALRKGHADAARRAWKRAIRLGISDAKLCFHYAIFADEAGLGPDDIRPALERAVALDPHFDDARYQLALLEKNAGHYEAALRQFQAMRVISPARAYAYWLALADTYNELGRRDEAQSASQHADLLAITASERARAEEETYIAQTDIGVRFARDATGRLILITARMKHGATDWNPFVEPSDDMRRVEGALKEIDCGKTTIIRVQVSGQPIKLAIPDLQHVQMQHAPAEFTCGPQDSPHVIVDYARTSNGETAGIVRGMNFE